MITMLFYSINVVNVESYWNTDFRVLHIHCRFENLIICESKVEHLRHLRIYKEF